MRNFDALRQRDISRSGIAFRKADRVPEAHRPPRLRSGAAGARKWTATVAGSTLLPDRMASDSSFSRLYDAWHATAGGRAVATAGRRLVNLARRAGLRARLDAERIVWAAEGADGRFPMPLPTSPAHRNYHVETVSPPDDQALELLLHSQQPRLLVIDVELCAVLGIAALRRLHRHAPATDWLLSWDVPSPRWLETLIACGARGALLREASPAEIARAFDAVIAGEIWLPRHVMGWVYAALTSPRDAEPSLGPTTAAPSSFISSIGLAGEDDELTPRESDALLLMRQGLTNKEIGDRLGISINTVKKHLASAFAKKGLRNRRQTLG